MGGGCDYFKDFVVQESSKIQALKYRDQISNLLPQFTWNFPV